MYSVAVCLLQASVYTGPKYVEPRQLDDQQVERVKTCYTLNRAFDILAHRVEINELNVTS